MNEEKLNQQSFNTEEDETVDADALLEVIEECEEELEREDNSNE